MSTTVTSGASNDTFNLGAVVASSSLLVVVMTRLALQDSTTPASLVEPVLTTTHWHRYSWIVDRLDSAMP